MYLCLCVCRKIQYLIVCLACSPLISKRDIPKPWLSSLISHKSHNLTAGTPELILRGDRGSSHLGELTSSGRPIVLRIIGHLSNIHSPSSFLNTSQISQHVVCRLVEGNYPVLFWLKAVGLIPATVNWFRSGNAGWVASTRGTPGILLRWWRRETLFPLRYEWGRWALLALLWPREESALGWRWC